MNTFRKAISPTVFALLVGGAAQAGPLANNQVSVDVTQLKRDSDASVVYVYDNMGTVSGLNPTADDLPAASTGSFDDDADIGYILAGTLELTDKWFANLSYMASEMQSKDKILSEAPQPADGRLDVFTNNITEAFDSAHVVEATYDSELSGLEVNLVYGFDESIDFIVGVGQIDLQEEFEITSTDRNSLINPEGIYGIQTDNEMRGLHVGAAWSPMLSDKLGFYLVGKFGKYDNEAEQRQNVDDAPAFTRSNSASADKTSTVTDLRLGLNYFFSDRLVLDVGYHLISLTDVALAESQFDTSAAGLDTVVFDDIDWDGYSLGLRYVF